MPWDSPIANKSSLFIVVSDFWESMFTYTLNRCYKVFHTLGVEFPLCLRTNIANVYISTNVLQNKYFS